LEAARPLPPSADIGPGGQSVGQAAQFCLVRLRDFAHPDFRTAAHQVPESEWGNSPTAD
jgi:hypothetical protein